MTKSELRESTKRVEESVHLKYREESGPPKLCHSIRVRAEVSWVSPGSMRRRWLKR
jgi:hypothetical protein